MGFRIGERCTLKIGGRLIPKTSGRWEVETLPQSFSVLAHYSCDWADEERESVKKKISLLSLGGNQNFYIY